MTPSSGPTGGPIGTNPTDPPTPAYLPGSSVNPPTTAASISSFAFSGESPMSPPGTFNLGANGGVGQGTAYPGVQNTPLASGLTTLYTQIPMGTWITVVLFVLLYIIDSASGSALSTRGACLSSTAFFSSAFFGTLPKLIGTAFVQNDFIHLFFAILIFIPVATVFEREVGTLQYFYQITLLIFYSSVLYVLILWVISWVAAGWGSACVCGSAALIYALLTIALDSNQTSSLKDLFNMIPHPFLPWLFVLVCMFLPLGSLFMSMCGIVVGNLYSIFILRYHSLPALNRLERVPALRILVENPFFIVAPGGLSLDGDGILGVRSSGLPGAYPSQGSSSGGRIFQKGAGDQDGNPLLWDDEDDEGRILP